eukprot:CAMPEP_0194267384 /NCGR_PEP_ID=MMETSP0169-20130528/1905_1 /TAXON_ID=218684 /ORGANISM="Corethron pennatum, Strain L29A3" /LENGTH=364 /DNA_ID=CAMNT_0039008209 /DNA_START=37 /DNA_END=1131 /DNA_ORIENTATION=+
MSSSASPTAVTRADVSDYYGTVLSKTEDLKTNACETSSAPPEHIRECLKKIHPDVIAKYYGCGLTIPDLLDGLTVLDLGCGSGRDVYIASQLVGPAGRVIGVDMTDAGQLDVARRHEAHHASAFGYDAPNTAFRTGFIERLEELDLAPGSVDVIVSNCVINLSPDKEAVLRGCLRLLKPGGELYFSDVYSDRRVPKVLREDKTLWGECISGALYWNDFQNMARAVGFGDPRLVEDSVITVNNAALEKIMEPHRLRFFSATYRLFKIAELEPHCEDYGQAVVYKGTVPRHPASYVLDNHHEMETGRVFPVCGNTYRMLRDTRLAPHFDFIGTWDRHYGIYADCGNDIPFASAAPGDGGGGEGGCC